MPESDKSIVIAEIDEIKWQSNTGQSVLKSKGFYRTGGHLRAKNKRCEEHRPERKLNTKWQEGRPWLQFNLEENLMTCSICMDYYRGKEMPINNLKGQNRFLSVYQQKNFCCDHFCSILTWTFLWNPIPETDKSIVIAEIGCRKKILSERIPLNGQWNNRTSQTWQK
jgi:hypothetical protein